MQYKKNTNYHSTIGMTPFQAIFSRKPPIGLSELGIPIELVSDISAEEDLDLTIQELNHSELPQPENSSAENQMCSNLSSQPQAEYFEFHSDPYLEEISQPLPNTVHVYEESQDRSQFSIRIYAIYSIGVGNGPASPSGLPAQNSGTDTLGRA